MQIVESLRSKFFDGMHMIDEDFLIRRIEGWGFDVDNSDDDDDDDNTNESN